MEKTRTIAVVDDDETIRRALDDLIHACGYGSALFATAEEFLAFDGRAGVDCILVDVKMPGMGGIELQLKLNADPPKPPMIFMTSNADDGTRAAAMAGGAFAFLRKPGEIHRLTDFMRLALQQKP
ncbi:response regulator transcription factor [Candidatus Phyllobacterium onerii]|uniref:response regulator transcription factor n=1 Tax=Candidatus Phyllobacterium onerii TaxID=3020828 RepID=UPI00232F5E8A|nr:response regulator [Phyllobacterium sp. IY22]